MEISDELRELILVGASGLELRRKAIDEGMITLRQSGLQKVAVRRDHDRRSRPRDGQVSGNPPGLKAGPLSGANDT